ncbi:T9SS type A sorting domain-containing protein [Rufibacter sp. XAAS-G3-1]|uniref:T9SS type A sorting domain-containing protein n=1 Tax=Rufibacter sp. XAAS-G3-1 TaxID=2729134 RepID=UPI0015E6F0FD|nr:T9SS type A sorting domain-containing protein [Rufibacter sp. XAAS-G3-1]
MKLPLLVKTAKILFLPLLLFFLIAYSTQASHIRAGNIYYKSDTTAARNPLKYFFTLVTYSAAPAYAEDLEATLHFGDCTSQQVARESRVLVANGQANTFVNIYRFEHTYAGPGSYTATYIGESTQGGVVNIATSIKPTFFLQSTITVDPLLGTNRSPVFQQAPTDVPARNHLFRHNSGAIDADGDSLSFKLLLPKTSSGVTACGNPMGVTTPGINGLENFLGAPDPAGPAGLALNRNTGLFTWNTPSMQGTYNVAILVEEWRNGRLIGTVVRDMLFFAQENPPVVTGVSEEWQQQVTTYPNPAASTLTLKVPAFLQLRETRVFTSIGTPVMLPVPTKSKDGWVFDVLGLPDGLYFLHLRTSQGKIVRKFIVQQ